ncbi:hypothetical protein PENTCL1PPCAC_24266, partial [Pristionchus entomophagus]
YLIDDILDLHFLLSVLGVISEEHGFENRRVNSEKLLGHMQFLSSDLHNNIASSIRKSEMIDDRDKPLRAYDVDAIFHSALVID